MNALKQRLLPYLDQARDRFEQLPRNDQKALAILTVFLVVVCFWFLVWRPIDNWADKAYQELELERDTQTFIAANYQRAKALVSGNQSSPKKDAAALIANSGKQAGLELARVQPARQGVSVWIEAGPYQKILAWLVQLNQRDAIEVKQIRIEKTDTPGVVKVFMRLSR